MICSDLKYLIVLTFVSVNLTCRKHTRKQQHGGWQRLMLYVLRMPVKSLLFYLMSKFVPDSTMWFEPPNQSIAVNENLQDPITFMYNVHQCCLSLTCKSGMRHRNWRSSSGRILLLAILNLTVEMIAHIPKSYLLTAFGRKPAS